MSPARCLLVVDDNIPKSDAETAQKSLEATGAVAWQDNWTEGDGQVADKSNREGTEPPRSRSPIELPQGGFSNHYPPFAPCLLCLSGEPVLRRPEP